MSSNPPSSGSSSSTCGRGRLLLVRAASSQAAAQLLNSNLHDEDSNQLSVDTDFDSYWEEEARNPHRNRIRIGRQYQATVPPVSALASLEHLDHYHLQRQAVHLETLRFCPKKAAQLSDAELHHYFTVAKSLNLFAELVQTRCLLGRDVTIADLNRIRNKEGLSLASVIQPPIRHSTTTTTTVTTTSTTTTTTTTTTPTPTPTPTITTTNISSPDIATQASALAQSAAPPSDPNSAPTSSPVQSPKELSVQELCHTQPVNQPLMKALSHFIALHHPCHHHANCKKLGSRELVQEGELSTVSDNLRQVGKPPTSRSRSALKQQSSTSSNTIREYTDADENICKSKQPSQEWSQEEIELFSKAIEVCGKNFGSIKKEFLPTKSVRSIVEYYYIGSRGDSSAESSVKRKASQNSLENASSTDTASCSPEKSLANNNNSQGGGSGGPSSGNGSKNGQSSSGQHANSPSNSDNTASSGGHINQTHLTSPGGQSSSHNRQATHKSDDIHLSNSNSNNKISAAPPPPVPDANGIRLPKISTNSSNSGNRNIDARMSVYNFDDEFKEESITNPSAVQLDTNSHKSSIGVKPLKAKPIMPNALIDTDSANSNLGSLKFFMDGQLILKLNACQDQQEGQEKCHWVQSGERLIGANSKQKKLTKKADRLSDSQPVNGSQSNSVVSSFQDDDSKTGGDDEDSKESLNSSLSQSSNQQSIIGQQLRTQHQQASSPSGNKRIKIGRNTAVDHTAGAGAVLGQQLPSPINYNRLAIDNSYRIKDSNNTSTIHSPISTNPAMNHQAAAAVAAMPWLQANSFAMAAALLGQLPIPTNTAAGIVESQHPRPHNLQGNIIPSSHNLTSKPMDLSLEHTTTTPSKPIQSTNHSKSSSRSKNSRPKNA